MPNNDWGIWKLELEVQGQKEALWFNGEASSRDILGLALAVLDRIGLCPTRCTAMKQGGVNERSVTFHQVKPRPKVDGVSYAFLLAECFETYAHLEVQILLGRPRALVEAELVSQQRQADKVWDKILGEEGASERIRREVREKHEGKRGATPP